ncbi:MAG: hypothetical protein ENTA_01603 [Enterocloster clostridioformis]|nr:MAG TPA: hypothetical protein [Caudoviricetes sp.]
MAINDLEKMDNYNPTNYVNNSEPDIDAEHLNKTENKLEETVEKANQIIDALKTLISTVQTNSETTVPSSSLAYSMQQAITNNTENIATINSNLANKNIIGTYNIPNITGVSTAPENITSGYHNVAKYSNGQCIYSALVYVYTSAIANSVIGTISSQYAPKQDVSAYVYDFAGNRFLMVLISSDGTIKLLTLEGTAIPESAVKLRGSVVF